MQQRRISFTLAPNLSHMREDAMYQDDFLTAIQDLRKCNLQSLKSQNKKVQSASISLLSFSLQQEYSPVPNRTHNSKLALNLKPKSKSILSGAN